MNPTISCLVCEWTMTALPWVLETAANYHAHVNAIPHPGVLIYQDQAWGQPVDPLDALGRAVMARN